MNDSNGVFGFKYDKNGVLCESKNSEELSRLLSQVIKIVYIIINRMNGSLYSRLDLCFNRCCSHVCTVSYSGTEIKKTKFSQMIKPLKNYISCYPVPIIMCFQVSMVSIRIISKIRFRRNLITTLT